MLMPEAKLRTGPPGPNQHQREDTRKQPKAAMQGEMLMCSCIPCTLFVAVAGEMSLSPLHGGQRQQRHH